MRDEKQVQPDADAPPTDDLAETCKLPIGGVLHDERGTATWGWLKEQTGSVDIGSTSKMLRRLDVPELQTLDRRERSGKSRGYDPYNQGRTPRQPKEK